ncbi:hypothetical protein K6119_15800 [Paracrocinitomix mangrovi]|uniref:hypothetical protein n=1 Tax=Paracrocinitomix mangrovi TaxID=2862509 RepID=UPI001C8DD46F|nr:hypothetical protein [Paracrocinitomix mangrovi]UKN01194.1 hypothetical protein K6119_15800 [Paracrocinitomix mangrovi]
MAKNQFSAYDNQWSNDQWKEYIPMNSFALKQVNELPDFIQANGLTSKFNSALVVASGSTSQEFYGVIGYRPDENNTVVDEHAFVYIRDKETDTWQGGIIHHADYPGRTSPLPQEITDALYTSGVTASISLDRAPDIESGSLDDLAERNILSGVSKNFYIVNTKINKD